MTTLIAPDIVNYKTITRSHIFRLVWITRYCVFASRFKELHFLCCLLRYIAAIMDIFSLFTWGKHDPYVYHICISLMTLFYFLFTSGHKYTCYFRRRALHVILWCAFQMIHRNALTLNVGAPSYPGWTRSISWLLLPRLLASPGHQLVNQVHWADPCLTQGRISVAGTVSMSMNYRNCKYMSIFLLKK